MPAAVLATPRRGTSAGEGGGGDIYPLQISSAGDGEQRMSGGRQLLLGIRTHDHGGGGGGGHPSVMHTTKMRIWISK